MFCNDLRHQTPCPNCEHCIACLEDCDRSTWTTTDARTTKMDYSLTTKTGHRYEFNNLDAMLKWIKAIGEIDGWTIHVHHL